MHVDAITFDWNSSSVTWHRSELAAKIASPGLEKEECVCKLYENNGDRTTVSFLVRQAGNLVK